MSTSARIKYINAQKLKVCLYILKKKQMVIVLIF